MSIIKATAIAFCCWSALQAAGAQQMPPPPPGPEISVGEISFSSFRWGTQQAVFELTNDSDELRFVTVEAMVGFTGHYLNPTRRTHSHHILEALESRIIRQEVLIPGNFGQAKITVELFDVVDTLDIILPGQKFFEQPFIINFHIPDGLFEYTNERVVLPPAVGDHPDFDNEFSRILLTLLHEGKSPGEIASLADCDTSFVEEIITSLMKRQVVQAEGQGYRLGIPFVSAPEADEGKKLAVTLAEDLAARLSVNMAAYPRTLDSLVQAGAVDPDSNAFLNGGTVLYRPYPVVSGLVLWLHLGRQFINADSALMIFRGSDPCNARIGDFMYAVHGGDVVNGRHFFVLTHSGRGYQVVYGDRVPGLECGENFPAVAKLNRPVSWKPSNDFVPETFMIDTVVVKPMLEALTAGTDNILQKSLDKLSALAEKYGHAGLSRGYKYWFWNLAVTRTLEELLDQGVVVKRGNGQFRFNGMVSR